MSVKTARDPLNCKLESCGTSFIPTVSWQEFCRAEHRDTWNRNHYCGHHRIIAECAEPGCESHALYLRVKEFESQFARCLCGTWFARKPGKVHCSAPCRWAAKDRAEKERRAKREARRLTRIQRYAPVVPAVLAVAMAATPEAS